MIYLDNAATSFPKPRAVVDALYECVTRYCGNPGRSSHTLSRLAAEAVFDAREKVCSLFNIDTPERIVFTYNATYALNLAIKILFDTPCHVITSDIEHNAVVRPLEKLTRAVGIEISEFNSDLDVKEEIESLIRSDTRGIVCTLCSNVTGKTIAIKDLSDVAKKYGLILIIDASQAAGHIDIDLSKVYFDAFCAPGHKGLFGIQGSGFVIFGNEKKYDSFIEGGSGSDSESRNMPLYLPERYEAGTLSTPAIVTLSSGVDFLLSEGLAVLDKRVEILSQKLAERLTDLKQVTLYSSNNGIVTFNVDDLNSEKIASALDEYGICTRAGLHCAPSVHKKLGTLRRGAVRASLSPFTTECEIDAMYIALREIIKNI
jgi:cysteine desulfurase family protein